MRVKYTTYDARREEDVIHVDTPQCNVMLLDADKLQGSDRHPYAYTRVIGIFHAKVSYVGQLPDGSVCYTPHRIDFCWGHWYWWSKAFNEFAYERASPYPLDFPEALRFFNPADILRAVHLIPQFTLKLMDLKLPIKTRWGNKQQPLWTTYFINKSVPLVL